jgi:hypothetical protein
VKIIVCHAAWAPGRRESLQRLQEALGEDVVVSLSSGPEHASIWGRRAWEWAARQDEHALVLNDDVIPHPRLRAICEAMIEAMPDECISLHTNVPGAIDAAAAGHHWVRCYWYTGPAVILPAARVRSLLAWLYRCPWHFQSRTNEDNLAIHWAWSEQRPFWCAIPAPVDHDTGVRSTLGYDDHAWRRPAVPWSSYLWADAPLTEPAWWRAPVAPPCAPNPWLSDATLEAMRRVLVEPGAQLCHFCQERQGIVSVHPSPKAPRLCYTCAMGLWSAATRAAQEARTT